LRRIYQGIDCLNLVVPLLEAASQALADFLDQRENAGKFKSKRLPR